MFEYISHTMQGGKIFVSITDIETKLFFFMRKENLTDEEILLISKIIRELNATHDKILKQYNK